jgi:hypothetical protein
VVVRVELTEGFFDDLDCDAGSDQGSPWDHVEWQCVEKG